MSQGMVDVTDYWMKAHPHLSPFDDFINKHQITKSDDLLFNGKSYLEIISKINLSDVEISVPFFYLLETRRFYVSEQSLGGYSEKDIKGVDARLWSMQPTFLNLEPTTRCNFSCWYCVGRHMAQADIEINEFVKIIDNFQGLKTLALVGEGEPLMHKGFFEMVKIARDRGIRVGTISNASTFSSSNIKKICESGINYISISIDSINEDDFASSRIGGSLQKTLNNIKLLASYRDECGYTYPKLGLKGTLFEKTMKELPQIVDMAKSYGVDIFEGFQALNPMITYLPIYPESHKNELNSVERVNDRIRIDTAYGNEKLMPLYQFALNEGIEIDNNGTPNGIRPNCDEQWVYSLLSGDVTPCCQIKNPVALDWNLKDKSIAELQNTPSYQQWRFNLWNGFFPKICQGCRKTG